MTKEHKKFLDELRESGEINMFSAGPRIMLKFGLDKHEAWDILLEWMKTFED